MMTTSKTQPVTNMNITDLEQRYMHIISAMAAEDMIEASDMPSLVSLMQTIKDTMAGEQLSFESFEKFFEWWDVITAYDQMDEDISADHHQPALEIAYIALVREGFLSDNFQHNYETKVAELVSAGSLTHGELDSYEAMLKEIRFAVSMEQIPFSNFADFFDFWELGVAVSQQNMGLSLKYQKPALEVLYRALVCEGFL
jgi:hypothetical protein